MMPRKRTSPRAEYRLRQTQRVNDSVTLSAKFPELKQLNLDLAYYESDGFRKTSEIHYSVNVLHAKSIFYFPCPSGVCLGGDFDLSEAVSAAVAVRRKSAEGELRCEGSRPPAKPQGETTSCQNVLRYRLLLRYD
jgi:hypothetical protein